MKARLTKEEYDRLPEGRLKAEYKPGEDEYYYPYIEADGGWAFENVENLRTTMRTERTRREEWERKHSDLAKTLDGVDPAEIQKLGEMKETIERMKNWTPDDKVQDRIASLEKTYNDKLQQAENTRVQDVTARDSRIKKLIVDAKSRKLLADAKCLDPDLFVDKIYDASRVEDNDAVVIIDEHGDPRTTKKAGAVGNMDLGEYIDTLKEQHPRNFAGSNASGGGGDPTGAGGTGSNGQQNKLLDLEPEARLTAIRQMQHAEGRGR